MYTEMVLNQQTSGSVKEKKKTRRQWIKKLRNELRMPGSAPQSPKQAPKIPVPPSMSDSMDWHEQRMLV